MQNKKNGAGEVDKTLAAVCGLYCEACNLYIGTNEDPQRLKMMAALFEVSEEEVKCYGCRADKRGPYCQTCKMFPCAADRGIGFCVECEDYPCEDLKHFQSEMPHRIELWDDLDQIKADGCENWLKNVRTKYACPKCGTINSAYDPACRKCGEEPSCDYVAKHKQTIEAFLKGNIKIR